MKVSIFTDASVRFLNCGYAFYIGCRQGKIQKAGKLKMKSAFVDLAELHCLANAIYTLKHSKFSPVSKVFIYCDNKTVVEALNGTALFKDEQKRKVVDEIKFLMMDICLKHGKTLRDVDTFFEVIHIKAHTGNTDVFSKINAWCDKNAKLYSYRKPNKIIKSA